MSSAKTIRGLLLICCSLCAAATAADNSGQMRAQAAGRSILGAPAPRPVLKTIDGNSIDLGSLYGKKAVYLKFWATWCVPCRQQMPHFQHAYESAGADLAVIAIDVGFNDSIEAVRDLRLKLGLTMPVVFDDGSLGAAFHVRVTPTHIVIGRDGRVRYVGHLADQELDAALRAARAPDSAGAPATATTTTTATTRDDPPPVTVGDPLPREALRTLTGQRFDLRRSPAPKTFTALVFLSPWCESYLATTRPEAAANCRSARTQFSQLSADPRIRWLGIASGLWANDEDLRQYRKDNKVTIPLTLDASGEVFRMFRVNNVPTIFIADGGGRIIRRIEGDALKDTAALRTAVEGAGVAHP